MAKTKLELIWFGEENRPNREASIFEERKMTDGRCSGVPKIHAAMQRNGSPKAKFKTDENRLWFVAEFPIHKAFGVEAGDGGAQVRPKPGPDLAVETKDARYLCEPKGKEEMKDELVLAKTRAATLWCQRASDHAGGKPWKYLLIPHDIVDESKTLAGLMQCPWTCHRAPGFVI
jgi:type III restriction enzyme